MCPTGRGALRPETTNNADLRPAFGVLDVNRDGKISRDDLRTFYEGFSGAAALAPDEEVIGSMISVADSNKDGYVEYDEFEKVLGCKNNGGEKNKGLGVMEEVFRVMDKDGDGKLGHGDLKSFLSWAGLDASDEDVKDMIRLGGGDENGGVNYEGLLKILAL